MQDMSCENYREALEQLQNNLRKDSYEYSLALKLKDKLNAKCNSQKNTASNHTEEFLIKTSKNLLERYGFQVNSVRQNKNNISS